MPKAKEMRDYRQDIKINENDLEQDWIEQASYFLYYAEAHAEALHLRDLAKAKTEYIYAVMYSELKKDWSKIFENKPTEPALKEHIITTSKFKKSELTYINACKDANIMLAAKTAFEHRKAALSNLTSLKIGGFYAEPRNKTKDVQNLQMRRDQKKELNKGKRKRAKTR